VSNGTQKVPSNRVGSAALQLSGAYGHTLDFDSLKVMNQLDVAIRSGEERASAIHRIAGEVGVEEGSLKKRLLDLSQHFPKPE